MVISLALPELIFVAVLDSQNQPCAELHPLPCLITKGRASRVDTSCQAETPGSHDWQAG